MKTITLFIAMLFTSSLFAQDTTTYVLKGKLEDFAFLRNALRHPEDVTPKQDSLMVRWVEAVKPEEKTEKLKK